MIHSCTPAFAKRLTGRPNAWAAVRPANESDACPERKTLFGSVKLYQTTAGVLVVSEFWGLPETKDNCLFILRVCADGEREPAAQPQQGTGQSSGQGGRRPAGKAEEKGEERRCLWEFPALQANKGFGWLVFLTSRFTIREVMGSRVTLCAVQGEQELAAGVIR